MTKLLVSVRSAAEARIALAGGADLIDVKEPTRGALGAPDLEALEQVVREVAGRVSVSVALGELASDWALPPASVRGVQYAKFGLAGCTAAPDWPGRWREAIGQLPASVAAVAVAYADWQSAAAPDPWVVLELGATLGCRVLLIDTFSKSHGSLVDHVKPDRLRNLIRAAHARGCECAVAGSLAAAQIAALVPLEPDYVAVRTAVCVRGRTSTLDAQRVRHLAALLRQPVRASSADQARRAPMCNSPRPVPIDSNENA